MGWKETVVHAEGHAGRLHPPPPPLPAPSPVLQKGGWCRHATKCLFFCHLASSSHWSLFCAATSVCVFVCACCACMHARACVRVPIALFVQLSMFMAFEVRLPSVVPTVGVALAMCVSVVQRMHTTLELHFVGCFASAHANRFAPRGNSMHHAHTVQLFPGHAPLQCNVPMLHFSGQRKFLCGGQFCGDCFIFQIGVEIPPPSFFATIWAVSCSFRTPSGGGRQVLLCCCWQSVCLSFLFAFLRMRTSSSCIS